MKTGSISRLFRVNRREPNKIPTTTVTNELTDAFNSNNNFGGGSIESQTYGGGGGNMLYITIENSGGTQGSSGTTPALLQYTGFGTSGNQLFVGLVPTMNHWYSPVIAAKNAIVVSAWNGQYWTSSTTNNSSLVNANNPFGYSIIWCDEVPVEGGC